MKTSEKTFGGARQDDEDQNPCDLRCGKTSCNREDTEVICRSGMFAHVVGFDIQSLIHEGEDAVCGLRGTLPLVSGVVTHWSAQVVYQRWRTGLTAKRSGG